MSLQGDIPLDATHSTTVMFLGLIYIKYIDGQSWWFDSTFKQWIKTVSYVDANPLNVHLPTIYSK